MSIEDASKGLEELAQAGNLTTEKAEELAKTVEPIAEQTRPSSLIITHYDQERWPILEMKASPCSTPISQDDHTAIQHMDEILDELGDEAAGIAAPQIGYPRRIFLLRKDDRNIVYINPIITEKSENQKRDGEGCLSLPGMGVTVKRYKAITLEYIDINGKFQSEKFTGFWARAVQHEIDHLNGRLLSHHLEEELHKQVRKTSFGMRLTPQKMKQIAQRRAKNRRAKVARRHQRKGK